MRACGKWIGTGAAVLLAAMAFNAGAQPPLEEELVNPGEVLFQEGQAYVDAGGGKLERLHSRQQDGATVYYRLVRYDNELGYVGDDGQPAAARASGARRSVAVTPMRRDGRRARPDFYNSPYNRDARQRYFGPGYFGSCSRYDGCKEVHVVPLVPVVPYRVTTY